MLPIATGLEALDCNYSDLQMDFEGQRMDTQRRANYLAELAVFMAPLQERMLAADVAAADFAKSVIKSGLLLNGGGLLALPAAVALFDINAQAVLDQIFWTGLFFVVGLLTSWLASMVGSFALVSGGDWMDQECVAAMHRITATYYGAPDNEQSVVMHHESAPLRRHFNRLRVIGLMLALLSFGFFAFAAYQGGTVLLEAPRRSAQLSKSESATNPTAAKPLGPTSGRESK